MSVVELYPTKVDVKKMADYLNNSHSLSPIKIYAIKMALGLPLDVVCGATTIEEAREAYAETSEGSDDEAATFLRWLELATTIEEVMGIDDETPEEILGRAVLQKRLKLANTFKEVLEIYKDDAVSGNKEQTETLQKLLGLITTIEEAREAYAETFNGSDDEAAILRKLATFFPLPE